MKYEPKITLIIASFFFIAQLAGIAILYHDIQIVQTVTPSGKVVQGIEHPETVMGERPQLYGFETVFFVLISVAIGTGLILLLVRFRIWKAWKLLFFIAVFSSISIALGVFLDPYIAILIALVLAILKIFRPEPLTHNVSEIFMYAGIVVLFTPLFDILWMALLLIIISIYDYIAVYRTKHMVTMARGLMETKLFAGFFLPLDKKSKQKPKIKTDHEQTKTVVKKTNIAVIGGGDIAFPMLFAGVVLEYLITTLQIAKETALIKILPIPIFATVALLFLLMKGKKGQFYPAMPFLTVGVFVGLAVTLLLI